MYGIFLWKKPESRQLKDFRNKLTIPLQPPGPPPSILKNEFQACSAVLESLRTKCRSGRSGPWVWARPEDRGAPWDAPFYLVFVVIISDWSIIAVQCCPTGISYKYTYIPSLLSLPPCSIPPLWVITEHQAECYIAASHKLFILSMVVCICSWAATV